MAKPVSKSRVESDIVELDSFLGPIPAKLHTEMLEFPDSQSLQYFV